jgi:hypothetical protein
LTVTTKVATSWCINEPNGMGDDTADDVAVLCRAAGKVEGAPFSLQ